MNTSFDLILHGDDEQHLEAVAVALCEEIQRLDTLLSRFNPATEIARINREAANEHVRVDRELFALLERCEQARELTHGYFDITAVSGGGSIVLNKELCTVHFAQASTQIDLGAIGKGYALDCAFAILARFAIDEALLNGGTSSVRGSGCVKWPIDIRHPLQPDWIVRRLELTNRALSCSAARHPGQIDSDVVNPLTGQRLMNDAVCLVLATNATEAEIFSTALLAMGRERAQNWLATHSDTTIQVEWF